MPECAARTDARAGLVGGRRARVCEVAPQYPEAGRTALPSGTAAARQTGYDLVVEISELVWTEDRIAHIGRHGVETEEFEEVCFSDALVLRTRAQGKSRRSHEDTGNRFHP